MIRSSPTFYHLTHSSNLSKLTIEEERSSPFPDSQGEDYSNYSGQDDDSASSAVEDYHEQRSPTDFEDRPLNLSCKRRKTENSPVVPSNPVGGLNIPAHHEDYHSISFGNDSQIRSKEVIEKMIMQYRAQLMATNDLVRALVQQRWHDEISSAFGRPIVGVAKCATQLLPVSTNIPTYSVPISSVSYDSIYPHRNHDYKLPTENYKCDKYAHNADKCFSSSPSSVTTSPVSSPPMSPANDHAPRQQPVSLSKDVAILNNNDSTTSTCNNQTVFASSKNSFSLFRDDNCASKVPSDTEVATSPKNITVSPENSRKRKCTKRNEGLAASGSDDFYSCSICGASYPHKFELNRHIKVSHVRPHRCTQCGKGFGHRNYLKVHIETVHMGQKTHQCRLCGKYLSTGGNLNVHVRTIHLGEKKYNCPVCSRSFGQQCNMKTHMKRHYSKSDEH